MNCKLILNKIAESVLNNWECERHDKDDKSYSIITDMLLPNNDCIEIMIQSLDDGSFELNDMGIVYNYLFLYGIDMQESSNKVRLNKLKKLLENYDAQFLNNLIIKKCGIDNLPISINLIIQAIREATVFQYLMRPHSKSNFKEKLYTFFASKNSIVNFEYEVEGKIKRNHIIDIRLNGKKSEILSKTISTKSTSQLQDMLERTWFAFNDIRNIGRQFSAAIFYDDTSEEKLKAIKSEQIKQIERSEVSLYFFREDKEKINDLAIQHT